MKNAQAIFIWIWNHFIHFVLQNGELSFPNGRNAKYCQYWLQNFTVTPFQLYAKDDFNALLQRCRGFSHWKITSAKLAITSCWWFEKLKWLSQLKWPLKRFIRVELVEIVLVVGPNLEIPFCCGNAHPAEQCFHCIALDSLRKRIRNGVLSVYFKIGLKFQVLKNYRFAICAQRHFSAWAANCQGSNSGLLQNFQFSWPTSRTFRWKKAIFTRIWNHFVLQNAELSFPNRRNSISLYFFSQNAVCQFILLQYTHRDVLSKLAMA